MLKVPFYVHVFCVLLVYTHRLYSKCLFIKMPVSFCIAAVILSGVHKVYMVTIHGYTSKLVLTTHKQNTLEWHLL